MSQILVDQILKAVTDFYLQSREFNGISAHALMEQTNATWNQLRDPLAQLIADDVIGVLYSDVEVNTHILRVGFESKDQQIAKLVTTDMHHTCIYPRAKHLLTVVDQADFENEPYRLLLALGAAQLEYRVFELIVLEHYRNDPRYNYWCNDISGQVSVVASEDNPSSLQERDQVLLQSFGFAYDAEYNRAVAVPLWYLTQLSLEHQHIWRMHELSGDYWLHPDYFRTSILGQWGERESIFDAFVNEIVVINKMAEAMGRPHLFRHDYGEYGENKPTRFGFLFRPTLQEFNEFVHLLDRMISDDINRDFFQNDIPYEKDVQRHDGKIVVEQKGTITILDEWIRQKCQTANWQPWEETIAVLRRIRRLRNRPAHALDDNIFKQEYFQEQRLLIIDAYEGIRTLRLLLANHPAVKRANIEIPDWLVKGEIWTY